VFLSETALTRENRSQSQKCQKHKVECFLKTPGPPLFPASFLRGPRSSPLSHPCWCLDRSHVEKIPGPKRFLRWRRKTLLLYGGLSCIRLSRRPWNPSDTPVRDAQACRHASCAYLRTRLFWHPDAHSLALLRPAVWRSFFREAIRECRGCSAAGQVRQHGAQGAHSHSEARLDPGVETGVGRRYDWPFRWGSLRFKQFLVPSDVLPNSFLACPLNRSA
jgi:hypothetical protein